MRWFVILSCCLLFAVATAQGPRALLLEGNTLLPARAAAGWLGAEIIADAQGNVTLTRGETTFRATFSRRAATVNGKAVILPAPALRYKDTGYLPARPLAEAFGATIAWDGKAAALTLTREGAAPLALPATPLPRPACLADETLAGLTIGDHLAQAVLRWGDPVSINASSIPGARNYQFHASSDGVVYLIISAREDEIVCISTQLGQAVTAAHTIALRATATGKGLCLAGDDKRVYGAPRGDYAIDSEDTVINTYPRHRLTLITRHTFFGDGAFTLVELRLLRRGFPRAWFQPMS